MEQAIPLILITQLLKIMEVRLGGGVLDEMIEAFRPRMGVVELSAAREGPEQAIARNVALQLLVALKSATP